MGGPRRRKRTRFDLRRKQRWGQQCRCARLSLRGQGRQVRGGTMSSSSVRRLARALAIAFLVTTALAALAAHRRVTTYTYTSIDYPGAPVTFAFGLNDEGTQI